MPAIQMKTKGALDRNSILSLHTSNNQGAKDRRTIQAGFTAASRQAPPGNNAAPMQQASHPGRTNMPVPALQNRIQKGQKISLPVASADILDACFGWNTTDGRCDIDVSAFLLGADGKVPGDSWFVFYGQTSSPDNSTEFFPESPVGHEMIRVHLGKLDERVEKIVFVLTINEALEKHLHFGMVKDAYAKIRKHAGGRDDLASFLMTEYYTNVVSMMIGELYRHNGGWKFNAIGNGISKDLAGLCEWYGVAVD